MAEGQFEGIQVGRVAMEARAEEEVGMPQAWKKGPRFLPTCFERRTIH